jgi:tripeptidyl-peptidase-2
MLMISQRLSIVPLCLASAAVLASPPRRGDFPTYGLLPKEDTGALRFLAEHPDYDGRGVVVAIFDTGVDPGAPGLQITSDGRSKIVDMVDGTGSGDVDTSAVVEAQDGAITGLTGRTLQVDPNWSNPTDKYHVGLKRAYELFPGELVGRLTAKHREKWDEQQRVATTALEQQLAAWDTTHASPSKDQKKEREEIETRLEQLKSLQEHFEDPGPIFDCVVFHDGQVWRAVLDTNENGDLAEEKLMTNYRLEHQWSTFSSDDLLNYALNIYDDGDLLSIVCDVGSHGTHVAGIVAANFPDQPELNGLAPGAQLVAVKIGDPRLDGNSCATGEIRGCIAVLQNHADLINQSFGEPSADPDIGRNSEIYSEIVNRYGVIYVSSAGNEGPALSTVGYPGSSTEALLAVGAYISAEMMETQYSLRAPYGPNLYTWTTRGPSTDGSLAVKFSAPGGAISPVPNWTLQREAQMNGTSMASPNACGNIALLLSALKAEKVAYSPHRIRRALENTAVPVPNVDIFGQGRGLIQIDRAYEYVKKFAAYADQDLRFDVRIPDRGNARGIYLREPQETEQPLETSLNVHPIFHHDADNHDKVDFEMRIALESTARWVECADHLMLMAGGRRMGIKIDPTHLPTGVHYAEIRGYDAASPERGPLFRVPITVVRPEHVDRDEYKWSETLAFEPAQIERRFFAVPPGATWADVRIRRLDTAEPRTIILQTAQLVPGFRLDDHQFEEYLRLGSGADETRNFKVVAGRTLEVCLAQFWSSLGECECEVELTFHGIIADPSGLSVDGSEIATRLNLATPLRKERVAPSASLDTLRRPIRPSKADIRPLVGERDRLPEERQIHELVLTYEFKLDSDTSVTPRVALANIKEYQEAWQSSLYLIFDSSKRVVTRWGLWPRAVSLSKGDYVLKFHLRHDNRAQLEQVKELVLLLDQALSKSVSLDLHTDPDDALAGGSKFGTKTLAKGARAVAWVASLPADKLPKSAQPGDLLLGTLTLAAADAKRASGVPVLYAVPPKPAESKQKDKDAGGDKDKDERTAEQKCAEAIRDAKVAQLAKLHGENEAAVFDRLAAEILADFPNHLPVFVEQLKRADGKQRDEHLRDVVDAADRLSALIDQDKLAAHYGLKLDPDDQDAAKVHKEMEKQKTALVDALHRKARALLDLSAKSDTDASPIEQFEQAYSALQKWVDTTAGDYLTLHIDREIQRGRLGQALKLLSGKIADAKQDKDLYNRRIKLLDQLGWPQWRQYEEKWHLLRFPEKYPPF